MTLRPLVLILTLGLSPLSVQAEALVAPRLVQADADAQKVLALTDVLKMDEILSVMRDEGLEYGKTLEDDMFPGRGGDAWRAQVARIYDPVTMRQEFDAALVAELSGAGEQLDQIVEFFGSDRGQSILGLEIEARRALLDPSVEDAAKMAWANLQETDDPLMERIMRFAEANDLIESNVMGALNSSFAFSKGLAQAGAFPQDMTEDQMLADIWGQEADVRAETTGWLFPFLSLAYGPMPEADMDAYIAFSETRAGQQINAALFAAFDKVFTRVSFDLGRAVALRMQGEDI
jgi:hypothetical protein